MASVANGDDGHFRASVVTPGVCSGSVCGSRIE